MWLVSERSRFEFEQQTVGYHQVAIGSGVTLHPISVYQCGGTEPLSTVRGPGAAELHKDVVLLEISKLSESLVCASAKNGNKQGIPCAHPDAVTFTSSTSLGFLCDAPKKLVRVFANCA